MPSNVGSPLAHDREWALAAFEAVRAQPGCPSASCQLTAPLPRQFVAKHEGETKGEGVCRGRRPRELSQPGEGGPRASRQRHPLRARPSPHLAPYIYLWEPTVCSHIVPAALAHNFVPIVVKGEPLAKYHTQKITPVNTKPGLLTQQVRRLLCATRRSGGPSLRGGEAADPRVQFFSLGRDDRAAPSHPHSCAYTRSCRSSSPRTG